MPLSPSQRIRLITDAEKRLAEEEYALIDLTLRQFGLQSTNEWSGTKQAYVVAMMENATDEILLDLAQHAGARIEEAAPRVEPSFWRLGMFRLFISHLATHREMTVELQKALLRYGITAFVAHNDIEPKTNGRCKSKRPWRLLTRSLRSLIRAFMPASGPTKRSALQWGEGNACSPFG